MAKNIVRTVTITDDIDGSEAVETVRFSIGDETYIIDLGEANLVKFGTAMERALKALAPFIEHGTLKGAKSVAGTTEAQDIRAWARENGFTVSDRGRVSQEVRDAYAAAHAE